jgi:hypothetical protein
MKKHFKQGTTVVFAILWVALVLVLGACSPDTELPEDTEAIRITNIPTTLNDDKQVYKVYIQLTATTDPKDNFIAKGEAKLLEGQTDVTITELKDPDGKPWKGTNWKYGSVVISPKNAQSSVDIYAKGGIIGPSTNKTVSINWEDRSLMFVGSKNLELLYEGIVKDDPEIDP